MKNTLKIFKNGDKVKFLGTDRIILTTDGINVHDMLEVGKTYIVKQPLIICLELEEIPGVFLKEHFRKVEI